MDRKIDLLSKLLLGFYQKVIEMKLANILIVIGILPLLSSVSYADITTSHIASDAEMLEMLTDTMFVSEGRIGDRGGAATFELDLGDDTGAPATTAHYDWQSGAVEPFTVSYNPGTGEVTFSLGGIVLSYITPYWDFEQIFVRCRAVNDGSWIRVDNLVIDGETVGDQSYAAGNGLDILWIHGASLSDGFVLTGDATLAWTGTPPRNSRLAFQIKVGNLGIIATENSTWGRIKSMIR
jgi:hypothetical protein